MRRDESEPAVTQFLHAYGFVLNNGKLFSLAGKPGMLSLVVVVPVVPASVLDSPPVPPTPRGGSGGFPRKQLRLPEADSHYWRLSEGLLSWSVNGRGASGGGWMEWWDPIGTGRASDQLLACGIPSGFVLLCVLGCVRHWAVG